MPAGLHPRPQRGGVTPIVLVATVLLAVVAIGGVTIGRLAAIRADTQRAADAAVLAALQLVRERGLPFDGAARADAEQLARRNSGQNLGFTWRVVENAGQLEIEASASASATVPTLIFTGGTAQVSATARAALPQVKFDQAERRLPKLVLVLDYSGSMTLPFSGGGGRTIDILETSVAGLLGANLDIDYGAVFFSTGVFKTVPISAAAPNQIISTMNAYDAGGNTNTGAGLTTARNVLLAAPDTGRYILLVSDGEPNDFAAARAGAAAVWDAGVTIYTLEVRRSDSGPALDQFMTDVAGTPTHRGDPSHHFVATSAASLVTEFQSIVASIVCKVGPLTPPPADAASLRVFLSQSGSEHLVPASDDLGRDRALERSHYDPTDQSVRLTATACTPVLAGTAQIVVRYDRPTLTH